ncbi:hypothetical protein NDU88_008266 [Pleurodeles waltl]|uniref:Uncharacterized protein n=1 Tax=Pleurodeles waltl TaxID=8319 RepID=A0AAV7PW39_PLEWA|nr:hypothetical protein NDU88_008266 [Pleurodeles waltl]
MTTRCCPNNHLRRWAHKKLRQEKPEGAGSMSQADAQISHEILMRPELGLEMNCDGELGEYHFETSKRLDSLRANGKTMVYDYYAQFYSQAVLTSADDARAFLQDVRLQHSFAMDRKLSEAEITEESLMVDMRELHSGKAMGLSRIPIKLIWNLEYRQDARGDLNKDIVLESQLARVHN